MTQKLVFWILFMFLSTTCAADDEKEVGEAVGLTLLQHEPGNRYMLPKRPEMSEIFSDFLDRRVFESFPQYFLEFLYQKPTSSIETAFNYALSEALLRPLLDRGNIKNGICRGEENKNLLPQHASYADMNWFTDYLELTDVQRAEQKEKFDELLPKYFSDNGLALFHNIMDSKRFILSVVTDSSKQVIEDKDA